MTSPPVALRHAVRVAAIVDYRVKSTLHSQAKADHDPQASLYLAGRWLEGDPRTSSRSRRSGSPARAASR
jgi:phage-related baseplate assembly protein